MTNQNNQTRRNFLRGAGAVALTAAVAGSVAIAAPISPVNPDSALLALCAEWHDTNRSCHEAGILEEQMVALSDTANADMRKIANIPALTVSGILAKLAVLAHEHRMAYPNQDDSEYADDALLITIYRDGERLSGLSL